MGILLGLNYFHQNIDFSWTAMSMYLPTATYILLTYFFLEGRKFMFVPFMHRWYNRIIDQEIKDYERYLTEEAE